MKKPVGSFSALFPVAWTRYKTKVVVSVVVSDVVGNVVSVVVADVVGVIVSDDVVVGVVIVTNVVDGITTTDVVGGVVSVVGVIGVVNIGVIVRSSVRARVIARENCMRESFIRIESMCLYERVYMIRT